MTPWTAPSRGPASGYVAAFGALVPEIVTDRLRLRAPRIEDAAAYAAILAEPEAAALDVADPEDAWLDFCQLVASWQLRGFGPWSIEPRDGGPFLGLLPLDHEYGDPEPEIGWFLIPEARGRGYATEAARAALDHAFGQLGFATLVSYCDDTNAASAAVATRLGAVRDRTAEAALDPDGAAPVRVYRHTRPEALA